MSVHIQMIGTGSAFAKRYFNNNAIVHAGDVRLLIDCGITAPFALHQMGIGLEEIDAILVTHIHGDHIGGLEEVAFRMKYIHKRKPTLYVPFTLAAPLWNTSLRGGLEDPTGGCVSLSSYFDVKLLDERSPARISEQMTVEIIPTKHIPGKPSYAVLMNENVFYSSDMTFDPALLTNLVQTGRCKHILHDCQLTGKGNVHTTLDELLTLPESIQQRIWLMHYGDDMEQFRSKTGPMRFMEQHIVYTFE